MQSKPTVPSNRVAEDGCCSKNKPLDGAAPEPQLAIMPQIEMPWRRIITYPDNHINDFCLFHALDGRWHAIGIMGTGTWSSEMSLFHCSSPSLQGPFEIHDPLLVDLEQGPTNNNAPQKHAPFVVIKDGVYHMFFRRPQGTNLLLRSTDLFHWPRVPEVVFEENDARDACIICVDGVYHLYYCLWRVIDGVGRSCISLRRSTDLVSWSQPVDVHVDTSLEVEHSRLESPYVVFAADRYWLFVCDRSQNPGDVTTVFVSASPDTFPSGERAWQYRFTDIHAAEFVQDNGQWYIARVCGPDKIDGVPQPRRWIDLAPINFSS